MVRINNKNRRQIGAVGISAMEREKVVRGVASRNKISVKLLVSASESIRALNDIEKGLIGIAGGILFRISPMGIMRSGLDFFDLPEEIPAFLGIIRSPELLKDLERTQDFSFCVSKPLLLKENTGLQIHRPT